MLNYFRERKSINAASKAASVKTEVDAYFLENLPFNQKDIYKKIANKSKSQCHQDLIALSLQGFKSDGYYLEIGAADGRYLSNTLTLEKYLSWNGSLVEPNTKYHKKIKRNRKNNAIFDYVIYSEEEIDIGFYETRFPELSTVAIDYKDGWQEFRKNNNLIYKKTISLSKLINDSIETDHIDFLSIDTEGSELEVIGTLKNVKKRIDVVCIEHSNISEKRRAIRNIMKECQFNLLNFPFQYWDDWFVNVEFQHDEKQFNFSKLID